MMVVVLLVCQIVERLISGFQKFEDIVFRTLHFFLLIQDTYERLGGREGGRDAGMLGLGFWMGWRDCSFWGRGMVE